jgi:hypothetical protein
MNLASIFHDYKVELGLEEANEKMICGYDRLTDQLDRDNYAIDMTIIMRKLKKNELVEYWVRKLYSNLEH